MCKRILSMLLALCMVLGMFPVQAFATDEQTKTTSIEHELPQFVRTVQKHPM